jgi:hypothetical protein
MVEVKGQTRKFTFTNWSEVTLLFAESTHGVRQHCLEHGPGAELGSQVRRRDYAEAAIKTAIEQFTITDPQRPKRLIAGRSG